MRKTLTLNVPTSWKDVKLKNYLELQKDLESYKDDEEAQIAFSLYHLCGLGGEFIKSLSTKSYDTIKSKLSEFEAPESFELQRFITIDGVEYGFEPNLSEIAYGAYADISAYDAIGIDKNWAKIMSILYRPVEKKQGDRYSITPYKGEINEKLFLEVDMGVHWGCLFFFMHLQRDLLNDTLKSLKGMELPRNIKSILEKSGEIIKQSMNLPMETYKK